MRFIDFFAGIGGISLGLERAGHECVGHCEIDEYACKVLKKYWLHLPLFGDITKILPEELPESDLWAAGFPCQNISSAGKKEGIYGPKSGLFFAFMELVRVVLPRFILLENVSMLTARNGGMGDVLGCLAACGYDAEWETIPAGILGAPHQRHRTFVVGYSNNQGQSDGTKHDETPRMLPMVANSEHAWRALRGPLGRAWGSGKPVPWDANGKCTDSALAVRVDDGLSNRMDRLRGCGNAVTPQQAEYIGRLLPL